MAEPAVIPPASTITPSTAAAPPAAPAAPVEPPTTAKPGTAKESVFKSIRAKAEAAENTPPPTTKPATPSAEPPKPAAAAPATAKPADAPKDDEPPKDLPPEKKASPWKLVKEKEARIKELEAKAAELDKLKITPERQKQIDALEAKAKALEEEIRFADYTKSDDYKENYLKPYEQSWHRALTDLNELTVTGPDGQERPIGEQDILELVNMPLQQARAAAEEKFGVFANDVMQHRKEIRQLAEKHNAAIEEARTKGAERDKLRQQEFEQRNATMNTEIMDNWTKANEKVLSHEKYGTYFKPVEGDQEGNQRLAKGFELADRAFSENPRNPNLTPEQRAAIIDRHAAVRNRCAAFGRLVYQNTQAQARIKELETQLGTYKQAEPAAAGSGAPPPNNEPPKGMKGIGARLQKYAT